MSENHLFEFLSLIGDSFELGLQGFLLYSVRDVLSIGLFVDVQTIHF